MQLSEAYARLCAQRQVGGVGQGECLSLCSLLESQGIFSLKKAKEARLTKVFTHALLPTYLPIYPTSHHKPLGLCLTHTHTHARTCLMSVMPSVHHGDSCRLSSWTGGVLFSVGSLTWPACFDSGKVMFLMAGGGPGPRAPVREHNRRPRSTQKASFI